LKLRLPSDGQYLIEACSTRPDFYYADCGAAIYIDGPPHDTPEQIRDDEAITARLLDVGYIVIRFHHRVDWDEIFRRHPDIFGVPAA
jgi:very-short-patch-repair endonuclease